MENHAWLSYDEVRAYLKEHDRWIGVMVSSSGATKPVQLNANNVNGRVLREHESSGWRLVKDSEAWANELVRQREAQSLKERPKFAMSARVTGDDVIQAFRNQDIANRIPVLKLEIEYELATLSDALKANDTEAIAQAKAKLQELQQEANMYELYPYKPEPVHA